LPGEPLAVDAGEVVLSPRRGVSVALPAGCETVLSLPVLSLPVPSLPVLPFLLSQEVTVCPYISLDRMWYIIEVN
jgi:hypothetical protein